MIIHNTIKGLNKSRKPPVWFMRQAGRYLPEYHDVFDKKNDFFDVCFDLESSSKITMQPINRFNLDAAIVFSDILVIPIALGCKVDIKKGIGPQIKTIKSFDEISFSPDKIFSLYETFKCVRNILDPYKSLIGFAGSPLDYMYLYDWWSWKRCCTKN